MPILVPANARAFAPAPFVLLLAAAFAATPALADTPAFTISGTSTSKQTIGTGQTGTITSTGNLQLTGTATDTSFVGVTLGGSGAVFTNLGAASVGSAITDPLDPTYASSGQGRLVQELNKGGTYTINNGAFGSTGATMSTFNGDVIQFTKGSSSGTVNNWGTMTSFNHAAGGAQVVDFNGVSSGTTTINNFGTMTAYEADAVRTGVNTVVNNSGTIRAITTAGGSSDGIDAQNNTGMVLVNAAGGLVEGGRHGITGGPDTKVTTAFSASITNLAGAMIQGDNGSGLNFDGVDGKEVVTVVNGGTITGNGLSGDGDGVDVDGLVNLTNTGTIRSLNSFSAVADGLAYSEGLSVGGGTITNSGTIEGLVAAGNTNAVGRGITLVGNDRSDGTRDGLYGNAVVLNQAGGTIHGQSDSAVLAYGAKSGYTVTITNEAGGTLVGGGTMNAAVKTGLDNDTLTNGGRIDGTSSGKAIDLGGGDNTLHIVGGQAVVLGDIDGGTGGHNAMTIAPGAGNGFSFAGAIANFDGVDVQSGTVTLSGASTYTGTTTIESGATLVLQGANRLAAASGLALDGGTLRLAGAGGANGQVFGSLALLADSTIDLGGSSLSFATLSDVAVGKALTVLDWVASTSPTYALRFSGDLTGNAAFRTLLSGMTIDGQGATYTFDGTWTNVTAVPEPASVALMLAGLGLLGLKKRRQQA